MEVFKNKKYQILTLLFVILTITILTIVDKTSNIKLSLAIQTIIIMYLIRIMYGCLLYIRNQYKKKKYSYSIIMNLGLVLYLAVNILRQINLLIVDRGLTSIEEIYKNTIDSFSYFAFLVLPFILGLAVYSVITNIFLIKKEGLKPQNTLGIVFGIVALLCTFASRIIYVLINQLELSNNLYYLKKFVDISINAGITYLYCIIIATLYCNIMAGKHNPNYDKDFVIILGCKIRKDGKLTPLLKGRVDRAIEFGKLQKEKTNKDIIYIPSGGKGTDETIAEATAIKNYLLEKGIKNKNIIIEDKSVNTKENMVFSKEKIDKINKDGKIIFSTTSYHVFRSGVIAEDAGIDCEGIGSKTKWYFYSNAVIREFVANLSIQRKQHISLLVLMNIFLLILVSIGYYYKFLN